MPSQVRDRTRNKSFLQTNAKMSARVNSFRNSESAIQFVFPVHYPDGLVRSEKKTQDACLKPNTICFICLKCHKSITARRRRQLSIKSLTLCCLCNFVNDKKWTPLEQGSSSEADWRSACQKKNSHRNRSFTTVFKKARHWTLYWAKQIQFTNSHSMNDNQTPLTSVFIYSIDRSCQGQQNATKITHFYSQTEKKTRKKPLTL